MNGILIVDKPSGLTSHDVVLLVRRRFNIKKVGHAGTLDPVATGVLVLLLGSATKLSRYLSCDDKEYEGCLRLGVTTDTYDSEGKVLSELKELPDIADGEIKKTFASFRGTIEQVPPMVSALKHKGRRLYKLARMGIELERRPRVVTIYDIEIEKVELPDIYFRVCCSKGTYIRKLADDIGRKLGCGAYLKSLRRIRSGKFHIKDSISLERVQGFNRQELMRYLLAVSKTDLAPVGQ